MIGEYNILNFNHKYFSLIKEFDALKVEMCIIKEGLENNCKGKESEVKEFGGREEIKIGRSKALEANDFKIACLGCSN